jgi:hypothetical protein
MPICAPCECEDLVRTNATATCQLSQHRICQQNGLGQDPLQNRFGIRILTLSQKTEKRYSKLIEAPTSSMGTVRLQVMGKSTMRSWLMDLSPVNRVRLRSPLMRWQMESSWLWYPRQQFTGTPVVSFAEDIWQALRPLQSSGQLWSCSCQFCQSFVLVCSYCRMCLEALGWWGCRYMEVLTRYSLVCDEAHYLVVMLQLPT